MNQESGVILPKLQALPKAELHVHLEGTIDFETTFLLAKKNNIDLAAPVQMPNGRSIPINMQHFSKRCGTFSTFSEFAGVFLKRSECLKSAEDIVLALTRYLLNTTPQNVVYSELFVTPTTLISLGLKEEELFEGLKEAALIARSKFQHELRFHFDIVRNISHDGYETLHALRRALHASVPVLGLSLAGLEKGFGAEIFQQVFLDARREGFQTLVHAGETAGAESIWEAIRKLNPDRIGHGIRAVEDKSLMSELQQRQTVVEVIPWSNIALQLCTKDNHPLPEMIRAGLNVVIASDDPGIFDKSLTDNYLLAFELGIPLEALENVAKNSIKVATDVCQIKH